MQKGTHIGKLLIKTCQTSSSCFPMDVQPKVTFQPTQMYTVVGGLGGIGLELVNWLVNHGTRNVTITSRTGQLTAYHTYNLMRMRQLNGANLKVVDGNAADESVCKQIICDAEKSNGVAGIFISSLVRTCMLHFLYGPDLLNLNYF